MLVRVQFNVCAYMNGQPESCRLSLRIYEHNEYVGKIPKSKCPVEEQQRVELEVSLRVLKSAAKSFKDKAAK